MLSSRMLLAVLAVFPVATVTACAEEVPADTSYEESLPAPVAEAGETDAPAPGNTSISGGTDERVDALASGENVPEEAAAEPAD